jgi:hypothetical protein
MEGYLRAYTYSNTRRSIHVTGILVSFTHDLSLILRRQNSHTDRFWSWSWHDQGIKPLKSPPHHQGSYQLFLDPKKVNFSGSVGLMLGKRFNHEGLHSSWSLHPFFSSHSSCVSTFYDFLHIIVWVTLWKVERRESLNKHSQLWQELPKTSLYGIVVYEHRHLQA